MASLTTCLIVAMLKAGLNLELAQTNYKKRQKD